MSIVRNKDTFVVSDEVELDANKANPIGQSASRWWWDAAAQR